MLIALSLSFVTPAHATNEDRAQCIKVIDAKNEQIKLCELGVDMLKQDNERLIKQVSSLSEPSMLKNPLLWTLVGLVIGVAITK